MDRKAIIVLVVSFAVLLLLPWLANQVFPPKPLPPGATNALARATNQAALRTNVLSVVNTSAIAPTTLASPMFPSPTNQVLEYLENENARCTFSSHGGGMKLVELKKYPESTCGGKTNAAAHKDATLNTGAPIPVLTVLGHENLLGDGVFKLTRSNEVLSAEKTLTNGLHLVKEFRLSTNYLVLATVRWENRAGQPLTLPAQHYVIGAATPMSLEDDLQALGVEWYDGQNHETVAQTWFDNHALGCACMPGTPRPEYLSGRSGVLWAAVHNQFFTIAVVPKDTNAQVYAQPISLPPPTREELVSHPKANRNPRGFQGALVYPPATLAPNQALERQFFIFAGPKEYQTLAKLGSQFQNKLDLIMGYSGFFGFFAKGLLLSMNGLYALGLSYALTIIVITIIIKVLFWPLTQASTRSMKRMAALQPQMKALQEKYKDDAAKMNRKLMEFMKENKVSPLGGCLPMMLQFPVFIGFYQMIRSAIELRGARFLWVCDLSKPDTLFFLPGLNFPVNPLPLLMGLTMLWQARLTPPSPGVDPLQQKMMKYMPLMFLFILYNFSAGLTLYWTVQNLLTIAQMKLTKSDPSAAASAARSVPAPATPPKKKK